jgi:hypothetical protein
MRLPLIASALILAATPAVAQANGYYSATLAQPAEKTSLVTRNTIWKCNGTTCVAPKNGARPQIMCELVAREAGALQAFTVEGDAFDAAALEKCNARAR